MKVWVVGAGGLLGSSVVRRLPRFLSGGVAWTPGPRRLSWEHPATLEAELRSAASAYLREAPSPWMTLWCAGRGVVGTPAEAMARETRALEVVLDRLGEARRPGLFFLAGSAGGIYGDSPELPLTEASALHPVSDYGRAKLRQEELVEAWAASHPGISTLTGRISNLYGPDQDLTKPQGLIAYLSRCLLHHVPAHVFAPLDTLRDHLYAPDAAEQILRGMARLLSRPTPERITKIIASGQTVSIGGILSIFSKIAKRQPRIVCSGTPRGLLQPSRLALRSVVWTDLATAAPTPLPAGIQSVYAHQLRLFQGGRLPLPPALRA